MDESNLPCPVCPSEYSYELGDLTVCSMCGHEWHAGEDNSGAEAATGLEDRAEIKDSVGNVLSDGDDVIVVKDLPVKGSPKPIKVGTKVKRIRLVDGVGDHDIEAKVDGFGAMQLKSSVVRRA